MQRYQAEDICAMAKHTVKKDKHSHSKWRRTSKDLQEIKRVLSHMAGGYIM
jgi:hypothetical protein